MNNHVEPYPLLKQTHAIFYKNTMHHLSNKKKIIGQFVMPLIISAIYIVRQTFKQNLFADMMLDVMLTMYIGLISTSAVRELVTLFITEREEGFRQYQMILGLSNSLYVLSNLLFMCAFTFFFLIPFLVTLSVYSFRIDYLFNFAAFVLSSCTLTMALTAFFKDHKIALEIIGMLFSLASFLPLMVDANQQYSFVDYIMMVMPNSAFSLAITSHNNIASLVSVLCTPVYCFVYSVIQFPQYYKERLDICCHKVSQFAPLSNRHPQYLIEQLELNEVINSQLNTHTARQSQVTIKAENISKSYRLKGADFIALNGINLKIKKKQIFGLLGRNGAGKTTLVDILTKVTKPSSGTFSIRASQNSIGICYQHEILYDNLTVDQHLIFYAMIKLIQSDEVAQQIQQIITTLGIQGERQKKVSELSGGNKRKLSVAIAILKKPQIIIFDEPTSGLDPSSRIQVWQVFQKLRSISQSTIILTTHHLDQAERLADWICVIQRGSIIAEDTPQRIKQQYGKGYHLSLSKQYQNSKQKLLDVQSCGQMIQQHNLKFSELEHIDTQINFIVKPFSKEAIGEHFQQNFIQLIQQLQTTKFDISFHSNSLQQSFLAILRDPDNNNSGDSLDNSSSLTRDHFDNMSRNILCHYLSQIWGIFLKQLYYNKSIFMQSIILYNINIIIVLLSTFFRKLFIEAVQIKDENGEPVNNANQSLGVVLIQGYIIMATVFISCSVYQRQKKIRAVLNTRGLSALVYWSGSFIFDYMAFFLNLLLMTVVKRQIINQVGFLSIMQLGVGIIMFSYCCSFLFDKVKTANSWFSTINIIFGMIIMPIIIIGQNTFLRYLDFIKYFYPYYDLTVKMYFFGQGNQMQKFLETINIKKPQGHILPITIIIYVVILVLIQSRAYQRFKSCFGNWNNQVMSQNIKLESVSKNYNKIQALKNVSYYVNEERLALLGHNGAGKSTTFGLISSQIDQTSGNIYIQGNMKHNYQRRLKSGGICYQDDALWDGVHVQEILCIISFMFPVQNSDKQWKWLFENLQFDSANLHKRFQKLSGGNKRKLCLMIALYAQPNIRLLDECSTGLDPSSRMAMVQTIKYSRRGCTVFTTHSISQAEALCSKAVIMGKGQVIQFDYINRLIKKYFNCCWIDIISDSLSEQKLIKQLQQAKLNIILNERSRIRIQIHKKQQTMSVILRLLQKLKKKGLLLSFTNVEPKLEDVYLQATKNNEFQAQILPVPPT